tara:strand:- start:525 stop:839 length:315 start_codon:yes stop_codon:yes gene_type:complete
MLPTVLVSFHMVFSVLLITLILMQKGKEAGISPGASGMMGTSQTFFGSRGAGSFMTRLTSFLVFCFFSTSIALVLYTKSSTEELDALFGKSDTSIAKDKSSPSS